ncbi:MAG: sensor histidine kinase [Coprococcus sp.]
MKVKFSESFRIRIMVYTCISLGTAILCDLALLLFCIRSRLLVSDYDTGNWMNHMYMNNNSYQYMTPGQSMLGESDIFYRIFGVGIKVQLIVLMIIVAVVVFLLVFFMLTRQMTGYIGNILSGVQQMADGDFEYRIDVLYQDEFSCIADGINRMADTVQSMQRREQEAEQTKNELITNVAHDLRTPLTSIIGYIDIVNTREDLTDEQKEEYLKIAWEKARKLDGLINELFSFTKISYGGMPMKKSSIDLIKLLEQEVDELYPSFEENSLTCIFEPDVDRCMIMADGERLVRVFDNLLGNAIRYGKDGKIIKVKTKTGNGIIKVQTINYGSVIPQESIPYLFEKFYKVDTARQSSIEGTGLGLAIAKSIVESHGGWINVSSSFDGTVFEVTLPVAGETAETVTE